MGNGMLASGGLFGRSWFWISNVTSAIGLISITDSLKSWAKVFASTVSFLERVFPPLAAAITGLGEAFHALVQLWRSVVYPVPDYLLGLLNLQVPDIFKDLFIVTVFVLVGYDKADNIWHDRYRVLQREIEGIKTGSGAPGIRLTKYDLDNYLRSRSGLPLMAYQQTNVQRLMSELGPRADAFAREVAARPLLGSLIAHETRGWRVEPIVKTVVIGSAALVAVLIIIDWIFFTRG